MPIIDAFRHPVLRPDESSLFDLSDVNWASWHDAYVSEADQHQVAASGICVMDQNVLSDPAFLRTVSQLRESMRGWFTLQLDLKVPDPEAVIRAAADAGCRGITFHSYLQRISKSEFPAVIELCQRASEVGLFVGLCTAYGSRELYLYDNLRLTVEILNHVDCPVVMYHTGGAKILEAMLIAEMWSNVYLETSFSLSYWLNSSVETDLAFAFRKLGCDRVMFGSDAPFVDLQTAISDHEQFLQQHDFSDADRDNIMGKACQQMLMVQS